MKPHPDDDPVYRSSRREAMVTLGAWAVCGCYTLTYCFLNGYNIDPSELRTYWGIPSWVLWGIWLPWGLAVVFSWWYSFHFVKDHELGGEPEEPGSSTENDTDG